MSLRQYERREQQRRELYEKAYQRISEQQRRKAAEYERLMRGTRPKPEPAPIKFIPRVPPRPPPRPWPVAPDRRPLRGFPQESIEELAEEETKKTAVAYYEQVVRFVEIPKAPGFKEIPLVSITRLDLSSLAAREAVRPTPGGRILGEIAYRGPRREAVYGPAWAAAIGAAPTPERREEEAPRMPAIPTWIPPEIPAYIPPAPPPMVTAPPAPTPTPTPTVTATRVEGERAVVYPPPLPVVKPVGPPAGYYERPIEARLPERPTALAPMGEAGYPGVRAREVYGRGF